MATIYYKGLTGKLDSLTVDLNTDTVDDLITAIATDEGLPTEYYAVHILGYPEYNDTIYGDSTTVLAGVGPIGLSDGDTVQCTLRQDGTKEQRQIQKLEIAKVKRAATSRTNNYNRDNLPSKYTGNSVIDNPNVGGLVNGRPWS